MTTHQVRLPALPIERPGPVPDPAGRLIFATPDWAEPWRPSHVVGTLLLLALGAASMVVCWYVGAGRLTYDDQVPWLVGSIASAGVVVLGGVYWLVCAFRQVALLQRDVTRYLTPWIAASRAAGATTDVGRESVSLVTAPRMTRVHRPECPMARGKYGLEYVTGAEAQTRGLAGCGACRT